MEAGKTPFAGDAPAFVGRENPLRHLLEWLTEEQAMQTRIASISGPGGIGKTFLLDHALRTTDIRGRRWLVLRVAGRDRPRTLAQALFDLVDSAESVDGRAPQFALLSTCRRALEWMDRDARIEVEKNGKSDPAMAKTIAEVFSMGVGLLQYVPFQPVSVAAKFASNVDKKHVESVVRLIQKARAYQQEKRFLNGILPGDRGLRNRLRSNLSGALAESLLGDLHALLTGWRWRDIARGMPRRVGRDRLLLILDDYERLGDELGDFLRDELVPKLARARFETLIIVLGRDRLSDTHPGWKQNHARHLTRPELQLVPWTPDEARRYVSGRGVADTAAVDRIVRDTAGYPYLLENEVEFELEGKGSALALQLFFDRTTRWMKDPDLRIWTRRLAFLDEITTETIPRVLPLVDPAKVLDWFKREASLRDPASATWSMLPVIRSKILQCVRNDSPGEFEQLNAAAARPPDNT